MVRGKKVAALGACEPEVILAGGTYIDLSPTDAYVDGTMVSAKGWTALAAFIRECLKVLIGFNSPKYESNDLSTWLATNPADVLVTNLGLPPETVAKLPKEEHFFVPKR